jgi:hypothetical protein
MSLAVGSRLTSGGLAGAARLRSPKLANTSSAMLSALTGRWLMTDKKHQVPQVPAPGGGTKDRSRDKDGSWREKRSDTGKTHKKNSK